ncbi:MAG: DUF3472 domain-containing protein [Planctomycetota bacterium]|nr:DUF3472 domain-containing protein [Planctomycetota bacterium]
MLLPLALACFASPLGPALAEQTLRVPAHTAYHDDSSEDGQQLALWFGRLGAGELRCSVELELGRGAELDLWLDLAGARGAAHVVGTGALQVVDLGSFTLAEPGFQRFELQAAPGSTARPELAALQLEGAATDGSHFNLLPRKNAASVHLAYPIDEDEVEAFYCEVTADEDPVWSYYMATGWHRGYFGMQVNRATERRIIFSVWDSGSEAVDRDKVADADRVTLVARGEDVVTGSFGNEGTGGHSHLVFDWKTGERQRFLVTARADDATHTTFSGYYFRPDLGEWMLISSWRAPKEGRLLRGLYSFSENFSGRNGHLLRRARFGDQWVRTKDGVWREQTRASFSFDGTGREDRMDRFMGVEGGDFFLSHGGFVEGTGRFGEVFERPVAGVPPRFWPRPTEGPWRVVLASPGGDLPFELELRGAVPPRAPSGPGPGVGSDGPGGDRFDRHPLGTAGPDESRSGPTAPGDLTRGWTAVIRNGAAELAAGAVELRGDELRVQLEPYDSRLVARLSPDGRELTGHWEKFAGPGREARLLLHGRAGSAPRFAPQPSTAGPSSPPAEGAAAARLDGRWSVRFSSDETPAVGLFQSHPDGSASGTFLTTLGDYRYLAGDFDGKRLRLSCFDGGHAFLFTATINDSGDEPGELVGDFWSRDSWHEIWTATRDDDAELPDSFGLTTWTEGARLADLSFPDATGSLRSLDDPAFRGKARILTLFGTWCPNCNDEAAYLAELDRRYGARGLAILGLAFELDEDLARSARVVDRFSARHGVSYPVLFAATADKDEASEAMPALDRVRAFPTTLFIDAKGNVRAVHTGFSGPATGPAHEHLRMRYESLIEDLLAE